MKYCQKLTRLTNITYASRNLFILCSSCEMAVMWHAKQPNVSVYGVMELVTVLHSQLFICEQFQDGSENISVCI